MAEKQIKASSKAFGQALQDVPLRSMFKGLAMGVADAQTALDENVIRITRQLGATSLSLLDADGKTDRRSLLELGLLPSFLHFSEARLELTVSLSMRTEDRSAQKLGLKASLSLSSSETTSTTSPASSTSTTGTATS